MSKFQRLLLDTCVIIYAHELGVWKQLTEKCAISVTSSVLEEADYWLDNVGNRHEINLKPYIKAGKVDCVDVSVSQHSSFCQQFGLVYLDRMDTGEADSLAFLYHSQDIWRICSGDGIVFKVLGCLGRPDQGISLEEVLQHTGLSRPIDRKHEQYTKSYRLRLTRIGQVEGITGMALKPEVELDKEK